MSYKKLGVSPKEFKAHANDKENPHDVTKEQIGLGNIKDEEQATKEEFEAHANKIASKDELGHVKVGRGLNITEDGVLSVPHAPIIYGVEIDEDNSDPFGRVKYIADSAGFEPLYTGDGNVDLGSWGDKFPINKVKVALMKDGEVVEELDENDYTKTVDGRTVDITSGDSGDVMVGIPLTYWKFERVGSKLRIYVSDKQVDNDFRAYAHSRYGVVQDDYLYIGAYKGNVQDDKLRSLHDVMSTGSATIGKFRDYAEANGEGYGQNNWATMTLMQIFTVLLTKSTDSQSALGRGYVARNDDYIKNGGTTKKGLFYGESTGKQQMKFMGIEDFWGNRYEWVDGLVTDPNRMWLINDKNTNYNDAGEGYTKHGECFDSDGYISRVDGKANTGFIPAKTGGSSSTHYADYAWQSSSGGRVAFFGGSRSYGSVAGAFLLSVYDSPSFADAVRGARLLYLKGGN